jgi:protein TonB
LNPRTLTICAGLSLLLHGALFGLPLPSEDHPAPKTNRLEVGLVSAPRRTVLATARAGRTAPPAPVEPPSAKHAPPPVPAKVKTASQRDDATARPPRPVGKAQIEKRPSSRPRKRIVKAPAHSIVAAAEFSPALPSHPAAPSPRAANSAAETSAPATPAGPGQDGEMKHSFRAASPLYADNPPPVYPREALRRRWGGEVRLRVTVAVDGHVAALNLERSSGHRVLDRAARRAVRNWRFEPARRGGQPVPGEVLVPVRFRLVDE